MSVFTFSRGASRLLAAAIVLPVFATAPSFSAEVNITGQQCGPRFIAANIKTAVLALKATEYCRDHHLPYSRADALDRLASLRCGAEASQLIDELTDGFDDEYWTILKTDARRTVCSHAASLSLD